MSNLEIKNIKTEELKKCASSPIYFLKKYCKIQHPQKGTLPFGLFQYQEDCLEAFAHFDYNIILKSRQLGISTVCAGYALWLMLFNSDKNVLVIATKQDVAKTLLMKVKFMYVNLPSWIREVSGEVPAEKNKLSLAFENGSRITAVSSAQDSARSLSISLLIIDEAAFIENDKVEKIWGSAQQTLATGGKGIILSTPNGAAGWFHKKWKEAVEGKKFNPIRLPWFVHPERDQAWRDEQTELLGPRMAAQECDCSFENSGNTVVDPGILAYYKDTFVVDPIERRGFDGNLWVWQMPNYSKNYIVCADVARGDGSDNSTFHVIDVEAAEQVAEYRGQLPTKEFGNMLVSVATEYNDALLVIENANVGWAAIQPALDRNYKNLYYSYKDINYVDNSYLLKGYDLRNREDMVPGFTTSTKSRPLIISKMELYLREKSFIFHSVRTLNELQAFIWKNGKPQAQSGDNDDLVMAAAIGLWVRDTAMLLRQQGINLTINAINSISTSRPTGSAPVYSSTSFRRNPYTMKVGHIEEDFSWLLR